MPAGARGGASAAKKIMANKKKRVDKVDTEEDGKEWMDEFVEATEVLTGQKKVEHNTRASFKLGAIHTGKHTMSPDDRFGAVADWCHRTVESWWFDPFIIFCICIVGIATGVQMSNDPLESAPLWIQVSLDWIGWITLIVFTLEVVLKILAAGRTPVDYFRGEDGPFNRFDFIVVALSWGFLPSGEGGTIAVMRLLRLLKIMNKIPALRSILMGLLSGLKAVNNIMLLLVLCIYLFAIVGMILFGDNDPVHFGTVGTAMLTLFQVATLAGWSNVYYISYYGCEHYNAGVYSRYELSDLSDPASAPALDEAGEKIILTENPWFTTKFGAFPGWNCTAPSDNAAAVIVYFYAYTVMTAFVVLSLFISVITVGMFEVIDKIKTAKAEAAAAIYDGDAAAAEVLAQLEDEKSKLSVTLDVAFGMEDQELEVHTCVQKFVRAARRMANSGWFNGLVIFAIFIVGINVGLQSDNVGSERFQDMLAAVDNGILGIFTVECVVKIIAEIPAIQVYFGDNWNVFDFTVVALSYLSFGINLGNVAVLRLLRLLRVFKLARSFPNLRAVVESLLAAFSSVGYVMILILIINYIFAILGMILFRKNDPQHWDSLAGAMMTVWQCETLDAWDDVLYANMYGCDRYGYFNIKGEPTMARSCNNPVALGWLAAAYFVILVVLGGLVLPTVLIGVISIEFEDSNHKIIHEMASEGMIKRIIQQASDWSTPHGHQLLPVEEIPLLRTVYDTLDVDGEDGLDKAEIVPFIKHITRVYVGDEMTEKDIDEMFDVIDVSGDGEVNFAEFLWFLVAVKRAKGKEHNLAPHRATVVLEGAATAISFEKSPKKPPKSVSFKGDHADEEAAPRKVRRDAETARRTLLSAQLRAEINAKKMELAALETDLVVEHVEDDDDGEGGDGEAGDGGDGGDSDDGDASGAANGDVDGETRIQTIPAGEAVDEQDGGMVKFDEMVDETRPADSTHANTSKVSPVV